MNTEENKTRTLICIDCRAKIQVPERADIVNCLNCAAPHAVTKTGVEMLCEANDVDQEDLEPLDWDE